MTAQSERDETQAAIDLLVGRLEKIRRDIRREGEGTDIRSIGLFKGDVSEILAELERHLDETAKALANANTGYAVSRAYLAVGRLKAAPAGEAAVVVPLDQFRRSNHAGRQGNR
ncbi:hypothetical protein CXZ10_03960 [Pleomorphomonas diazotrophica]|uniref:Uncharacterized protein n=1 Tax=Pleomorphomonas diazotrophica TaxID=1166257 RepID=A0A1I4QPP0_9HYPH|nr:hypothetical protein [Pleomorphomonas diazotrophica]PKR90530.1 hypothetical protein CXZ10_03960 [Pleomorphomonas diazotrophica]SFM41680.1 hypothetical protein SAMN05192571_101524 [Pleomorphomonas diazotrophica]